MPDRLSRILLTGATGFVGQQVLLSLPADADIHCVSRHSAEPRAIGTWHAADLRDPAACAALIAQVRPGILIHCAWTTEHGAFWHDPDNALWLQAGKALFDAFVYNGGQRIVACGTGAEYTADSPVPRREEEEIDAAANPFLYARAKLALLDHLRSLKIDYAWARIFLAYGQGEDVRRLVPSVLAALAQGEPAKCSSGSQIRDFMDVRDLGAAIALLATSGVQGVVNLGSGEPASIADVVTMLGRIAGRPDLVRLGALPDRPGEPRVLVPEIDRQTEELGYRPAYPLNHGLADAAQAWLADHKR